MFLILRNNKIESVNYPTLKGLLSGTGGNLTLPTAFGNGNGFMDVTGGLAASYFDTDAMFDFSDLEMSSSFHKNVSAKETGYNLSGSIFVNGDTRAVPTPSVLWLVVIGLASMVSLKRKTA